MKAKIVYIVTFDENNYYFEQVLVSACSARMHNPNSYIVIVTDENSGKLISGWRMEIYKYINEVICVKLPEGLNNMQKSRWMKTNLRNIIGGDFLFIDTDTIICRQLDDIEKISGDILAVPDWNCELSLSRTKAYTTSKFAHLGLEIDINATYFNSGVLFVRDNPNTRKFYADWHRNWQMTSSKGVNIDQISLSITDRQNECIIKELPGEWNCQTEGKFINYLCNAFIIHYFAFSDDWEGCMYYFKNKDVFERIKNTGHISEKDIDMLSNPYKAFTTEYEVLNGQALRIYAECQPIMSLYGSPRRFILLKWLAKLLS